MGCESGLGQAVRQARVGAGLSQADLGERLDLPQSYIAKIEAGADLRISTISRVLKSLGLKLSIQPDVRSLFEDPPANSSIAAARDFGVDLGQLYANYLMSPGERFAFAIENSNGLASLLP